MNWTFEPKPDISLYELALCLGPLLAATGGTKASLTDYINELPPEAKRHFRSS
jgi:hypothetical protein